MIYNLANLVLIIVGSLIGLLFKNKITESMKNSLIKAMGLSLIYVAITMMLKGKNTMLIILSVAFGTIIGEFFKLEEKVENLGDYLENKFSKDKDSNFSKGFVSASIIFCAGAMGIVGAIDAGLTGNGSTLMAKSMMDAVASCAFAAAMGIGVMFSSITVFIYQAVFIVLAGLISNYLSESVVASVNCVGGIIILGICFNMVLDSKIKVMNIAPAVFIPIILSFFKIY